MSVTRRSVGDASPKYNIGPNKALMICSYIDRAARSIWGHTSGAGRMGDAVARLGREEHCVDGKLLSNQRFVDDIVIFWTIAAEAGTMLKELNEALMKIGLQINRKKTQFMKNAWCE
ncbi:unnamed protein product [Heligmosomoides polygyrus]|uniref:Reverse transcriptase domain-containing protein n=1 Tax=Heligmosomoides polygyrus TaxID=6339 RepID=A0A3P8E7S9_HELPZ|nr:unnamed protein product [Heligmosomoides polygyrus]